MNQQSFQELLHLLAGIAPIFTATGVLIAAYQLRRTKRQAITSFEDSMAREYREISTEIPTEAFLNEELTDEIFQKNLKGFYHYIDLTNEQVFLRSKKRISCDTWEFWCVGIKSNLERPAFKRAWNEISSKANGDFHELRRVIKSNFKDDPAKWRTLN